MLSIKPTSWPTEKSTSSMGRVAAAYAPILSPEYDRTCSIVAPSASRDETASAASFRIDRTGVPMDLNRTIVSFSVAPSIHCFRRSATGASREARNRVPIKTPSAPRASIAASPRPSATPPPAITGIDSDRTALLTRTSEPTSPDPTNPPPSNPRIITASAPTASARTACLTRGTLWMMGILACLIRPIRCSGERPAVSNAPTRASMPALTNSSVSAPASAPGQHRDIEADRPVRQPAGLLQLPAEVFGTGKRCGGDKPDASGIGSGGNHFGHRDVVHGTHEYGVADIEELGDPGRKHQTSADRSRVSGYGQESEQRGIIKGEVAL